MDTTEPLSDEERHKHKLIRVSKYFFIITLIYSLWIVLLISGVYFLQLGNTWAVLTIEQWLLSAIVLICIFIVLEVILVSQYLLVKKEHFWPKKRTQKEYIQGKRVYRYTIPPDAKGGIFSKTYILIDENRILNLRYQMITPNNLWEQKQEI